MPKEVNVASALGTRDIAFGVFDPVGREVSRSELGPTASGTTTSTYDALGRLGSSVRVSGGSTKQNWAFNYDPLGNIIALGNSVAHSSVTLGYQSSGQTVDYDQLCTVTFFGPIRPQCNVTHDSFGNVISEPAPGATNSFSYFNAGDVKRISNTAGMTATFAYDPFGDVQDLNITSSNGQVRHDQHFGDLITLRSQNAQTPSTSLIARQFPGPGMTISRRGSQGPWVFEFSEPQGTRFTTDENGKFLQDVSYTPFGGATSSGSATGTSTFTTEQWNDGDALEGFGLTKIGKRIYDPAIGRFLSRDPLAIPRTAATTNPYAFAMNDPINLSDPTGMDPCPGCGITAGSGIGSASESGDIAALAFAAFGYLTTLLDAPSAGNTSVRAPISAASQARISSARIFRQLTPSSPSWSDEFTERVYANAYDAGAQFVHLAFNNDELVIGLFEAVRHPLRTGGAVVSSIGGTAQGIIDRDPKAAADGFTGLVSALGPAIAAKVVGEVGEVIAVGKRGIQAGEAGSFGELSARGVTYDNLTPHHMPQAALEFTPYKEGGALVLPHEEHVLTRTYGTRGALTRAAESGMKFRDVLARDIRDIRKLFGPKYDQGLRDLLSYYRKNFPDLMRKK